MFAPFPVPSGVLELRKPGRRREPHQLWAGDAHVGRLTRAGGSGGAEAEAADGAWSFAAARGLISSRIDVHDGTQALGTFERTLGRRGGRITIHGNELEVVTAGGDWHWAHAGTPLVTLDYGKGDVAVRFEVLPAGESYALRSLLVLLGGHALIRWLEE